MKRALTITAALLILVAPAAFAAPPAGKGKPDKSSPSDTSLAVSGAQQQQAEENAATTCKAERDRGLEAFKTKYGTNANKSNAFGKCVSSTVDNAAKKCKKLRKDDPAGFKALYGDRPNAYGKCVSATSKKPA